MTQEPLKALGETFQDHEMIVVLEAALMMLETEQGKELVKDRMDLDGFVEDAAQKLVKFMQNETTF